MKHIPKARRSALTYRTLLTTTFLAVCTVLCPLAATVTAQSPNADLGGTWKGELGEGSAKLHLVLTITKSRAGEFSGELNSVDQGATLQIGRAHV